MAELVHDNEIELVGGQPMSHDAHVFVVEVAIVGVSENHLLTGYLIN